MRLRVISLALFLALLFPCLASCADKTFDDNNTTTSDQLVTSEAQTESETGRELVSDGLPDKDFGGAQFNILCRDYLSYEIDVDSEMGEVVNDAIYNRNRAVEDRFNVKINTVAMPGDWSTQGTFMNALKASVQASDGAYDLVAGYAAYITSAAAEGYLYDWNKIPNIDFSKPWWSADALEEMTVNKKLYLACGDISLSLWNYMIVIFFNKKLIEDYEIENPYTLVRDGKWTIDKIAEISKSISSDIDGNGKYDRNDLYGLAITTGNFIDAFHAALDQPVTRKDDNDVPYLVIDDEKMINIVDKLYNTLYNNPGVYVEPESEPYDVNPFTAAMFAEDRLVFVPEYLGNSENLRDMKTDFGILPYPKWDEAQQNYHTLSQGSFSLFCVPSTVNNIEMSGIITEALCAESYKKVIPAYYDVALKSKYARDDESSEMMDIIRDGITFNFGYMHSVQTELPGHQLRSMMAEKKNDWVSRYETLKNKINKAFDKIIQQYMSLE